MKTFVGLFVATWRDLVPSFAKLYFTLLLVLGVLGGLSESHFLREKANALVTHVKAYCEKKL